MRTCSTRSWAEDEAKKAREHARALEEARNQWERQGIKVVVEGGLEDDASAGVTWANVGKEHPVDQVINRAESLLEKLKSFFAEMKVRSGHALERVMQYVRSFISSLKERAAEARQGCASLGADAVRKVKGLSSEAKAFGSSVGDKSKKVVEDCKEGLEKFAHRFKTD
jgi:flagellar biosynthesis/type III secretory pathway protein FliH